MPESRIFLDNNATTPLLPEVVTAVSSALRDHWGNPSSGYSSAEEVRAVVERSREKVGSLLGSVPESIVFTSGGTEANNSAILAAVESAQTGRRRVVTSAIEHASILSLLPKLESLGFETVVIGATATGEIDLQEFLNAVDANTAVASLQWVNNETGVIQPVGEVCKKCQQVGAAFHTDASQAVGKLPISFADEGFDYLTFTGHKIHAPKGVGALVSRKNPATAPLLAGGTQEFGVRPGTENVPGIVGLGAAVRLRQERLDRITAHTANLRDRFEQAIRSADVDLQVNGEGGQRVGNTTNIMFPGVDGAAMVNNLDLRGIECSQSSACTHARPEPSHVLTAMGLSEEDAYSSIRFSFSELNTEEEVEIASKAINEIYQHLKSKTSVLVG